MSLLVVVVALVACAGPSTRSLSSDKPDTPAASDGASPVEVSEAPAPGAPQPPPLLRLPPPPDDESLILGPQAPIRIELPEAVDD